MLLVIKSFDFQSKIYYSFHQEMHVSSSSTIMLLLYEDECVFLALGSRLVIWSINKYKEKHNTSVSVMVYFLFFYKVMVHCVEQVEFGHCSAVISCWLLVDASFNISNGLEYFSEHLLQIVNHLMIDIADTLISHNLSNILTKLTNLCCSLIAL